MKGSAVVQGLKSITDKLHPQLPLTSRESRQLLTALTTSFRRHLDEVHPGNTDENSSNHVAGGTHRTSVRTLRSSAAYTDWHLASVLTNPLLARESVEHGAKHEFENVRTALTQDRSRNPILLFEEYDKKGTATIAIAELCLDAFKNSLDVLTLEERAQKLTDVEPGRKLFLWLLRGQHHTSSEFIDSPRLTDLICYFLLHEGREDAIWEWLRLDVTATDTNDPPFKSDSKLKLHRYRWRNKVINALVRSKLGLLDTTSKKTRLEEVNAAMDAFLAAFKMQQAAQGGHHLRWFSLTTAAWALRTALISQFPGRSRLDGSKYDKFLDSIPVISSITITSQSYVAGLQLRHPTRPSTSLAWTVARSLLMPDPSKQCLRVLHSVKSDELQQKSRYWYSFLAATAHCLAKERRVDEATWIRTRIMEEFPLLSANLEQDLQTQKYYSPSSPDSKIDKDLRSKDVEETHSAPFLPSFG